MPDEKHLIETLAEVIRKAQSYTKKLPDPQLLDVESFAVNCLLMSMTQRNNRREQASQLLTLAVSMCINRDFPLNEVIQNAIEKTNMVVGDLTQHENN